MTASEMSLFAKLGIDTAGFTHGIGHAANFAREQFKGMAGMFAAQFTIENIIGTFEKSLSYANSMRDNAEATGVSVEKLQTLSIVVSNAGANVEKLQKAFFMLQQAQSTLATAGEGADKLAVAFEQLGLQQDQVLTSSPDRILELIGAKLASGSDEARNFAAAMQILGEKVGPNFIAALKEIGTQGLDNLTAKMKASGLIMEDDLTKRLDAAKKTLERLEQLKTIAAGKITDSMITLAMSKGKFADRDEAKADLQGDLEQYRRAQVRAKEIMAKELPGVSSQERVVTGGFGGAVATDLRNTAQFDAIRARALEEIKAEDVAASAKAEAAQKQQTLKDAAAAADRKNDAAREPLEAQAAALREKRMYEELSILQKIATVRLNIETLSNTRKALGDSSADRLIDAQLRLQEEAQKTELAQQTKSENAIRTGADKQLQDLADGKGLSASPIAAADNMAKIGGYVGGQTDPLIRVAERQLQKAERTNEILAEMNAKLGLSEERGVTE